MKRKILVKILKLLPILVILGLVYYLFQEDINVRYYQFMEVRSAQSHEEGTVFKTDVLPGYVEYISDDGEDEIVYPQLSSVEAALVIPSIKVRGKIVNGTDDSAMNEGFWHYPSDSPFADKGNVVIIGHRYLKLPPHQDTFYSLNKVKVGDEIRIESKFDAVHYVVTELLIIDKDELAILHTSDNARITLVTCHPLWTSKQRLVVVAEKKVEALVN